MLVLGRRIPPVMVGIVLLATAALFPPVSNPYYLVFALPVAALVARDPDGPPGTGIFDRRAAVGDRRRAVGVWVSLAAAFSIAHVALPSPAAPAEIPPHVQMGPIAITDPKVVITSAVFASVLWLVACGAIMVSYARRPAREDPPNTAVSSPTTSELVTESSPQRSA